MNHYDLARRIRAAKTLADAILILQQALDAERDKGVKHEQDQQWLRDTTGPKPRIRITC